MFSFKGSKCLTTAVTSFKTCRCWILSKKSHLLLVKTSNNLYYCTENALTPSQKMTKSLKCKFPLAKKIEVVDISGGCGSMYEIFVESNELKGLTMVKQHRLINEVLKEDIKQMHGLRIHTKIPDEKT